MQTKLDSTPQKNDLLEDLIKELEELNEISNFSSLEKNKETLAKLKSFLEKFRELADHGKLGLGTYFIIKLDESLVQAMKSIELINNELGVESTDRELEDISRGLYQRQFYWLTYYFNVHINTYLSKRPMAYTVDSTPYMVYPIMDLPGLKCTAAIPKHLTNTVEIQINFLGTIDFASQVVDMEKGGPGQETLKIHEVALLKQINCILEQLNTLYPTKEFRLRIAGHSLGGALAKGLIHSIQRACAILENSPETIIENIKKELVKEPTNAVSEEALEKLKDTLKVDQTKFKELKALSKIKGLTLYALGSPGISKETDKQASLLSYYHKPEFLRAYHHFHKKDITVKFGETEFLSGKEAIKPRVQANKAIQFDIAVSDKEVESATALPFPGLSKQIMAVHNKLIYMEAFQSITCELNASDFLLEKYSFPFYMHFLYDSFFSFARLLACSETMTLLIPELKSWPENDIGEPKIESKDFESFPIDIKALSQFSLNDLRNGKSLAPTSVNPSSSSKTVIFENAKIDNKPEIELEITDSAPTTNLPSIKESSNLSNISIQQSKSYATVIQCLNETQDLNLVSSKSSKEGNEVKIEDQRNKELNITISKTVQKNNPDEKNTCEIVESMQLAGGI